MASFGHFDKIRWDHSRQNRKYYRLFSIIKTIFNNYEWIPGQVNSIQMQILGISINLFIV